MSSIRIPTKFKLLGQTIHVEHSESLFHAENVFGWAQYRENRITLQQRTSGTPIPKTKLEETFLHELMHHILYIASDDDLDPPLHKREGLVQRIAGLLYQALTTAEYSEPAEKDQ